MSLYRSSCTFIYPGHLCYSPTAEPAGDFRFIDARPEPARQPQIPFQSVTADARPGDVGMDVEDDDMKEIAKFLPMLQESGRPYRPVVYTTTYLFLFAAATAPSPKPKPGPIPLALPSMYFPGGVDTPVQPAASTRASSLASTTLRNSAAMEDDDGDYVYDLYYRDPVVSVKDLNEQNSGMSSEAIGAL